MWLPHRRGLLQVSSTDAMAARGLQVLFATAPAKLVMRTRYACDSALAQASLALNAASAQLPTAATAGYHAAKKSKNRDGNKSTRWSTRLVATVAIELVMRPQYVRGLFARAAAQDRVPH